MNYVHRIAFEYLEAGICVIPLRLDGSKAPFDLLLPRICDVRSRKESASWKPYQQRLPTGCEMERWFSDPAAIGMVCGAISGGLEVMDFDAGELFEPWYQLVARIVDRLPVVATPSSGWHVLYRCNEISGNEKIALDPSCKKPTLIETRGEGGYVVAEGSACEAHATGLPYCQAWGPALPTIPRITPMERRELWAAARTFDRRGEVETRKLIAKQNRISSGVSNAKHPVIAAFCDRTSWDAILERHGWTSRDGGNWTRPGKSFGVSARVVVASDGEELLTVFSGNAGPLSPDGGYRTWNKFDAWAALEHRGDNRAAFIEAKHEVASC